MGCAVLNSLRHVDTTLSVFLSFSNSPKSHLQAPFSAFADPPHVASLSCMRVARQCAWHSTSALSAGCILIDVVLWRSLSQMQCMAPRWEPQHTSARKVNPVDCHAHAPVAFRRAGAGFGKCRSPGIYVRSRHTNGLFHTAATSLPSARSLLLPACGHQQHSSNTVVCSSAQVNGARQICA